MIKFRSVFVAMSKKIKILIIDDEESILQMFAQKFEKENFEVFTKSDPLQGILEASQKKPDVVLLDIMMPEMDGFETLSAFRQSTSLETIIIVFSNIGGQNLSNIEKAMKLGADEYLVKSDYTPSQVVKKVNEILESKKTS